MIVQLFFLSSSCFCLAHWHFAIATTMKGWVRLSEQCFCRVNIVDVVDPVVFVAAVVITNVALLL
mgnify:CR=1 FL=1